MDLEIQSRRVALDTTWRDLIERLAGRFSQRYPEMLRLNVTVLHERHHRRGTEGVALVANVEGVTLRAEKQAESVPEALRTAFAGLCASSFGAINRNAGTSRRAPAPG